MASFPSLSVRSGNGWVGKRPFPSGRALFVCALSACGENGLCPGGVNVARG